MDVIKAAEVLLGLNTSFVLELRVSEERVWWMLTTNDDVGEVAGSGETNMSDWRVHILNALAK